jgi:hypothetical protein
MISFRLLLDVPNYVVYVFFCCYVFCWWRDKRTLGRSLFLLGHLTALLLSLNYWLVVLFSTLNVLFVSNDQNNLLILFLQAGGMAAFLTHLTGFILVFQEEKREEEDRVDETFWEA